MHVCKKEKTNDKDMKIHIQLTEKGFCGIDIRFYKSCHVVCPEFNKLLEVNSYL